MTLEESLKKALGRSEPEQQAAAGTGLSETDTHPLKDKLSAALGRGVISGYEETLKKFRSEDPRSGGLPENVINAIGVSKLADTALNRITAERKATVSAVAEANRRREEAINAYVNQQGITREEYDDMVDTYRLYTDADKAKERVREGNEKLDASAGALTAYQNLVAAKRGNLNYIELNDRERKIYDDYKEYERTLSARDKANQAVRYHEAREKQNAVLEKYGVNKENPDYQANTGLFAYEDIDPKDVPSVQGTSVNKNALFLALTGDPEGMTEEEAANVRYLYRTAGREAAKEYAELFEDSVNTKLNTQAAQDIINIENGFLRALGKSVYGAASGISQFATGTENALLSAVGKTKNDTMAEGGALIRESIDNVIGRGAYDLVVTAANMAPSIVLASVTGNPTVGAAAMGASAGGNAYAQAMAEGKPVYQSVGYGILTGVSEACLQEIIGGIGPLASSEGVTKALTGKIASTLGTKAAEEGAKKITKVLAKVAERSAVIGVNALFEGGEEYLQDILEPVFRNVCFNENNEFKYFTEEALYSGIIGALMGGGDAAIDTVRSDIFNYRESAYEKKYETLNKIFSGEDLTGPELNTAAGDPALTKKIAEYSGVEIKGTVSERKASILKAVEAIRARGDNASSPAKGEDALSKAKSGRKLTNSEIAAIISDRDLTRRLAEATGVSIEGTNSQRRAAVREAVEKAANGSGTDVAAGRNGIAAEVYAQNENAAQNGSQRVTERTDAKANGEANAREIKNRIADFGNPKENYSRGDGEINVKNASLNKDGTISITTYDGKTVTIESLRTIAKYLRDNLHYNFVAKSPSNKRLAGYFVPSEKVIRSAYSNIATTAHEVGHFLDGKADLQSKMDVSTLKSLYGQRALGAGYGEAEVGGEMIAEFVREYFRNYYELAGKHADIVGQFENALREYDENNGTDYYRTVRTAADMFNGYVSLLPGDRHANMITTRDQELQRLKNENVKSVRDIVNKIIFKAFDSAFPLKIGGEKAYVLQSIRNGNLGMQIQSLVTDGVRDGETGAVTVPGMAEAFSIATENAGGKNKREIEKNKIETARRFEEYLIYLDELDSLTIGERYDEATKVSKTLEAIGKKRIEEITGRINGALEDVSGYDYKYLLDTLNSEISNCLDADMRKILRAIEDALPRYSPNRAGRYTTDQTKAARLARDLSDAVKTAGAGKTAELRNTVGEYSKRYADHALSSLFDTVSDLITKVDLDAIKQNIVKTDPALNDEKALKDKIKDMESENPDFIKARESVRAWYDAVQDMMVDSGIWSEEQVDMLRTLHPNYIGLHRSVRLGDTEVSKTNVGRKEGINDFTPDSLDDMLNYTRKGSDAKIYDALQQATYFAANVMSRVSENEIIKAFYEGAAGDKDVIYEDPDLNGSEPMTLTYYEGGKPKYFAVTDPLIIAALKWEKPTLSGLRAVRAVTNLTKRFATQYNPAFIVRNVARDVQQAYRNGSQDSLMKFAGEWVSAFIDVVRGSEDFKNAETSGLERASVWRGMLSKAAGDIEEKVGLKRKTAMQQIIAGMGKMLTVAADVTEATTRFAEVKRQLKAGKPMNEAVYAGQEVTTNFTRSGASTAYRVFDTFIPFFGANVQGMYNNIKQFVKYDPRTGKAELTGDFGKKLAKTAVIWAIPTILQYALLLTGDDEEKEEKLEAFRAETNYIKNTYWLIWAGDGTFAKVPKSQILTPAFAAIERAFDTMALEDPLAFNSFIDYTANQLLIDSFTDTTGLTGIGTINALEKNKDWRGTYIDTFEAYGQNVSAKYHYDENTSWAAKKIGDLLNVSPQKIDYVIGDLAPYVRSFLQGLTSESSQENLFKDPVGTLLSASGMKTGLTADSVYSTDIRREYYNYKEKVNTVAGDAKNLFSQGTSERQAKKFGEGLAQNANYYAFNGIVQKANAAVSKMGSAFEKREATRKINRLMTELSDRHGETSGGGTALDRAIAELYSDYETYAYLNGNDKSLSYWRATKKYVGDLITDDNMHTVNNLIDYYHYAENAADHLWEEYANSEEYKTATNIEKADMIIRITDFACSGARDLIIKESGGN